MIATSGGQAERKLLDPRRRARLDREERQDRFTRIRAEFLSYPRDEDKETLLEAFFSKYKALSFGSTVGLEALLVSLERWADQEIRKRKVREGIPV